MISVLEADKLISTLVEPRLLPITLPLSQGIGKVLQEPIIADRDYPPFDRICMDGIAIRFADYDSGLRTFKKQGLQRAGDITSKLFNTGECIEVMTGTPLPTQTDTCVRYEDLIDYGHFFEIISSAKVSLNQNIHPKGTDYKAGDVLVKPKTLLNGTHIGIAASVGKTEFLVSSKPKITIISTGDELVDPECQPLPHQIRKSNSQSIKASLELFGFDQVKELHCIDSKGLLEELVTHSLSFSDVIILIGGVSAGKFDFVPEILTKLKVQEIFHRISQRPGKPLWVGEGPAGQIVFGLPGNPVASLVCFRRFLLPLLKTKTGLKPPEPTYVVLATDVEFKPKLTWFLPVQIKSLLTGQLEATPRPTRGSGDFSSLGHTDGFIEIPDEGTFFKAGSAFPFYSWIS